MPLLQIEEVIIGQSSSFPSNAPVGDRWPEWEQPPSIEFHPWGCRRPAASSALCEANLLGLAAVVYGYEDRDVMLAERRFDALHDFLDGMFDRR